jgi:hypothetical protein
LNEVVRTPSLQEFVHVPQKHEGPFHSVVSLGARLGASRSDLFGATLATSCRICSQVTCY